MTNRQKRLFFFFFLVIGIVLNFGSLYSQQTAGELFEKALYVEEAQGDLEKAIGLYQQILNKFSEEREVCAKAQLQIGLCYEKLGNAEAIKAYEKVLKDFADRPEQVAIARERLAALRQPTPSETVVQEVTIPEPLWEEAVLSPDGTKIAGIDYTIGQNIAFYDLSTKQKTLVTHFNWIGEGAASTYYPVWRPDGTEIAYSLWDLKTSKAELWVSSLGGKARFLCRADEGGHVPMDWLPDGSIVVALFPKGMAGIYPLGSSQLGLISSSGGPFRPFSQASAEFNSADASPDGRYIVLDGGSDEKTHDIVIMSVDGRTKSTLAAHPADDKSPRFSPDGKHVVFLSKRHGTWALWGIPVEGGQASGQPFLIKDGMDNVDLSNWATGGLIYTKFINIWDIYTMLVNPLTWEPAGKPELISYAPTGVNKGPAWSHDGKFFAFAAYSQETPNVGRVVVMSTDDGKSREFPIPSDKFQVQYFTGIRWCPDDSGLGLNGVNREDGHVFFHLTLKTGEWKAYPVDTDWPRIDWGKDGRSYYYAKWGSKDQNPGIIEHQLDSGQEMYVYRPEKIDDNWFAFRILKASHDYKWLGFMEASSDSDYGISVLELETGKTWRAAPGLWGFAWSPEKKFMIATTGAGGTEKKAAALYVLPGAGGTEKKIDLGKTLSKAEIMSVDWSPDGKTIAFDVMSQIFEICLIKNLIPKEAR